MSLAVLANHMASKGRNGDSMLVHMSPDEVRALQALAERHGKTLTINPETGQPEAFSLKSLLPMIAGLALGPAGFGLMSAGMAGLTVGGITALATGDISRGLMAGLGAYGGAGLGEALAGAGSATAEGAAGALGVEGAATGAGSQAAMLAQQNAGFGAEGLSKLAESAKVAAGAAPSTSGALSSGLEAITKSPEAFGQFAKDNWKTLAAATVPPMLASEGVKTTTPRPMDTGYIRQKKFNPYTQQYIDLEPVKASEWGSRRFSDYADGGIVALADGGVSDTAVQNWFASNAGATDAQIAQAMDQFKVSPEQVARVTGVGLPQVQQRYEAAIAPQIVSRYTEGVAGPGGTTATPGTGYLGIYDDLTQRGITAQELFNAPGYKGWSQPDISRAYDVAAAINTFDPRTDAVTPSDKEWVAFMDANKFSTKDIAQATGLSQAEVQRRYDAVKNATKQTVVLPPGGVGGAGVGTTDTYTGGLSTTPQTYAPPGTTNPYGNYMNPGDITRNPDGTVTVQPNIPGRPYGGFTGIGQLKDAYTAGGGSLGPSNLFVPKTVEDMYARYGNTGGSQQAYQYLMGKGAASIQKPATRTGELMLPYAQSVLGMPYPTARKSTQKYIFDPKTRSYVLNPDYVDPLVAAEEKKKADEAAAAKAGTTTYGSGGGDSGSGAAAAAAASGEGGGMGNSGEGGGGAGEGGWAYGGVTRRMALGGLGALAAGGSTYNLGSYSDGGRLLRGPGDGVSDSIPATIGDKQPARLADGEFVVPARIVSELGNGSTDAGARKLYAMMDRVQRARGKTTGKGKVAKDTSADKYLPA